MEWRSILVCLLAIVLINLVPSLQAQVPGMISYQGRIVDNGTNFEGTGQFKFALILPPGGTNVWSNDGSAAGEPVAAVSLTVNKGLYSVLLGDTTVSNMTMAIPMTVFANSNVRLRVWFNDGVTGFQQLTPDQRIAAVGYAMMASTVPNGAITATQLASNAVTAANLAPGAVTAAAIANGAVGANQLAGNSVNSLIQSNLAANGVVVTNTASFLNVKFFGATGNGSTDDSIAIQNAMNAAELNDQAVYFPAGTYLVGATLTNYGDTTNLRLFGEHGDLPGGPTIRYTGSGILFSIWNSMTRMDGLYLQGPGTNVIGSVGVFLNLGDGQALIQNCYFTGWGTGLHIFQSTGNHVEQNRVLYNNTGILVDGDSAQTVISGNWIGWNHTAGIVLASAGNGPPQATLIEGDDGTVLPGAPAVYIQDANNTTILNLHAEDVTTAGIVSTNGSDLTIINSQLWGSGCPSCYPIVFGGNRGGGRLYTLNVDFNTVGNTNGSVVLNIDGSLIYDLVGVPAYQIDTLTSSVSPYTNQPYTTTNALSPVYNVGGTAYGITNGGSPSFSSLTANSITGTNNYLYGLSLGATNITGNGTISVIGNVIVSVDTTAANATLTLSSGAGFPGYGSVAVVKNVGTNVLVIQNVPSSVHFDGQSTLALTGQYSSTVIARTTNGEWSVLAEYGPTLPRLSGTNLIYSVGGTNYTISPTTHSP